MSQKPSSNVPKFGSFKPKSNLTVSTTDNNGELERSSSRHHHGSRNRYSTRTEHKSDRGHHNDRNKRDERRKPHDFSDPRQRSSTSPKVGQDEVEESSLFVIDKRGDPKNVEFGSLDRYRVPAYHGLAYNYVNGPSPDVKKRRQQRPLTAKYRAIEPRGLRVIASNDTVDGHLEEEDFISLRPALKRKRGSESPSRLDNGPDYRSIEGKSTTKDQPEDEDLEYASESDLDDADSGVHQDVQQAHAALNREAKENPTHLEAWITLIDFQSNVVRPGANFASLSNSERRALADIRLSIYARALKHVKTGSTGSEQLLLGSIEEGSKIWESSKLANKWNEALKENPTSILLWTKYLDFAQTDRIDFRYDNCKALYVKCFQILDQCLSIASPDEQARIASTQIYVFVRFTSFMRDAGYDELACALWQVLLEYHFFKPPGLASREASLESLELFWESDVPRIGEDGALGWNQFAASTAIQPRRVASVPTFPRCVNSDDRFARFSKLEADHIGGLRFPTITNDDSDADDPFRFVMFSDLRDVVECLVGDLPKTQLLNAFLCFMHIPPLQDDEHVSNWQTDPFLCSGPINYGLGQIITLGGLSDRAHIQLEKSTTSSLLYHPFRGLRRAVRLLQSEGASIVRFINRVLDNLVSSQTHNDVLAEYCLAFKLGFFVEEAPQVAERLLKARPTSLRLYNIYALVEARRGRSKAKHAWSEALLVAPRLAQEIRDEAIVLWHSWVLTLLHQDKDAEALGCLVSMPDDPKGAKGAVMHSTDVTAAQRLRVSQQLHEGYESLREKRKPTLAVLYVDCLAWFSYFLADRDLQPSLSIYEKLSTKSALGRGSSGMELLHQAKARMMKLHIEKRRPYKPAVIRKELENSLELFPENGLFLELHAQVGAQTRIDDRLRETLRSGATDGVKAGLMQWSFRIAEEFRRCSAEGTGSTHNSVRALFVSALLSPDSRTKHSPHFWMLWFDFEVSLVDQSYTSTTALVRKTSGDALRRVKQVFYDGLRHLPWYKPWIIRGLSYFRQFSEVSNEELHQIYDVLTEREMRVRVEGVESLD